MAKCTRQQLESWNAKCSNGFKVDLHYFLTWGYKEPQKFIKLPDGKLLGAKFGFYEVRDGYRHTGEVVPKLHLSIWEEGENFMTSHGMGACCEITNERYTRRNFNLLARLTAEWDDERIMEEAKKHVAALNNPFIM